MMRYHEDLPMPRAEVEAALAAGDEATVANALLSATVHDPDWRWVQDQCVRLMKDTNPVLRGLAVTCLGHLARLHGVLDLDKVLPLLREVERDPVAGGRVEDALDDIHMFATKTSEPAATALRG